MTLCPILCFKESLRTSCFKESQKSSEIFKSRRDISGNPSHDKVKISRLWLRKSLQVYYTHQLTVGHYFANCSLTYQQHAVNTSPCPLSVQKLILISFVGSIKENFSHWKLWHSIADKTCTRKKNLVDELSKTRKLGPERWIVAFAFPTLDSNYFFWTQDTRYKIQGLSLHSIHHWYVTNTWPMVYQCIADTINIIATDCWPTVDRWSVNMSVNTRPIQDQNSTDAQQILNNTQQKYRSSCRQTLGQYIDRHVVQNSTDMLTDTLVNTCHKIQDPY